MSTRICNNPAFLRYVWPGKSEAFVCATCAPKLVRTAANQGFALKYRPVTMADGQQRCTQQISEVEFKDEPLNEPVGSALIEPPLGMEVIVIRDPTPEEEKLMGGGGETDGGGASGTFADESRPEPVREPEPASEPVREPAPAPAPEPEPAYEPGSGGSGGEGSSDLGGGDSGGSGSDGGGGGGSSE